MDYPIIARVYFDRKPPFTEEAIMRMNGEQVKVSYELQVKRVEATKKVEETDKKTVSAKNASKVGKKAKTVNPKGKEDKILSTKTMSTQNNI